nr:uncharacterized mitochondrial protein AtMg00810-like [Tanacetum cinerariifolium]
MTGNISYLTDYEEIDGGYVALGGNPKGGKIIRKGTIKTGNLDFKSVYFVRELKFNLLSVSQICDEKNSVLFNDTECIILSPNFNLIDESQVLLRVPRKNNMYSVDLRNIVPKGGLICLFAKATSDESKLWHIRARIVEENLHSRFSESTPNVVCSGPDWLLDIDALTRTMNYEPIVIGTQSNGFTADPPFSQDPKSSHDDGSKPLSNDGKKVEENPRKENECNDQEKKDTVNITNNVNTVSSTVNTAGTNEDNKLPFDPNMPALEDIEEECMYVNHQDLKIQTFLIEYTKLTKHCINYIKLLVLDVFYRRTYILLGITSKAEEGWDFFICQDEYVAKILEKYGFTEVKTASTPIETQNPLLKDEDGEKVDVHMYRSMIGSLMYLTSSRPDIMLAVCACARYQVNPNVSHLHIVKRIFRYLKGQPKLGLWYLKDSLFDLVAYTNSDYDGASLDRKSTTGGYQFLGCRLISWQCKKQTVVENFTTKAKYVAASSYYR